MHFLSGMSLIDPRHPKNEAQTLRVGSSTQHFPSRHVLDFVKSLDKRGAGGPYKLPPVTTLRFPEMLHPNCIGHCDPALVDPYNESDTLP